MATSALEALHRAGMYQMHLLVRPPYDDLFRSDPRISEVIALDDRGRGLLRAASLLRARAFRQAVDFTHSLRSRILWSLGAISKVYRDPAVSAPAFSASTLDRSHQLLRYIAVIRDLVDSNPSPIWPPAIFLPEPSANPAPPEDEVLIFPAAAYGPAKQWSIGRYIEMIRRLADLGWPVRLLGAASDRGFLEQIVRACEVESVRSPAISADLGLVDLAGRIRHARVVITCDSGPAHLSAALGRPTLVLFFSTDPSRTVPVGYAVRPVVAPVPCRPCFLRSCPIGYLCRDSIAVDLVMHEIEDLLDMPPGSVASGRPPSIHTYIQWGRGR